MENSLESGKFESEAAHFWIDENNIVCIRSKGVVRTLEKQKKAFELLKSAISCDNTVMLVDLTGSGLIMIDEKTREYVAWTLPLLFKAVAVVAKTTLEKVAPKIFLSSMDLSIPVRLFDTEEEAKEWLKIMMCNGFGL